MSMPVLSAPTLSPLPGIRHGFFTRQGGVSTGIYDSMNCGPGSKDATEAVAENRARAAAYLGAAPANLVSAFQIHSAEVATVSEAWTRETCPRLDAMVTDRPGIALGVLAADCGPVLFTDTDAAVVGAAHSGWKGALTGVLEATVDAMIALGARSERITAVLGPCIHQPSYEVGPEFPAPFLDQDQKNERFFAPSPNDGHFQFDLPGYVLSRLNRLNLKWAESLGHDTYSNENILFSYRRATHRGEDGYGRNLSAIMLSE